MGIHRQALSDELIPYLSVRVSLPLEYGAALQVRGRAIPAPIVARLVVDTGSAKSSLTSTVVRGLECSEHGTISVQGLTGSKAASLHLVRVDFLNGGLAPIPKLAIACLEMPPIFRQEYQGVLGRDVLHRWETLYSGPRRRLTIRDHASVWGWLFA